jgi:hypothetical protein
MKLVPIFLLFLLPIVAIGQDYRIYHRLINNAQRCYFLNGNTDSAFHYYDSAFARYDFVFAQDCFMAAQIAYYHKDSRYMAYLRKGFAMGITPKHLTLAPVFAPLVKDTIAFKKRFKDYAEQRKLYRHRLDTNVLANMIRLTCQDQANKRMADEAYAPRLEKTAAYLHSMMNTHGYPGEKLIGLTQADIMEELGQKGKDLRHYKWGRTMEDWEYVAQVSVTPILIHMLCPYYKYASYWDKFIMNGEIHPRDVAMFHDAALGRCFSNDTKATTQRGTLFGCGVYEKPTICYRMNFLTNHAVPPTYGRRATDSARTAMFISTIAIDSARDVIGRERGFKTGFGLFY